jgi:CheY-like chemotaxis protein
MERDDDTPITAITGRPALNVLVIDSDHFSRALFKQTLLRAGSKVFELASPAGATALILGHRIDVVIIDMATAASPGDGFVSSLRENPLLARLGILLASSAVLSGFDDVARSMGADGFVTKFASPLDLTLAVTRARNRAIRR